MAPVCLMASEKVELGLDNLCCLWSLRQNLTMEASRG
jgi:hypothetical protein